MSPNWRNAPAATATVGVAAALAWFAFVAFWFPFDPFDEGYVLYVSKAVLAGKQLYGDIELFTYLPGLFYFFVVLIRLTDGDIATIHLALAVPMALNSWLAYRIVADWSTRRAGIAAAVMITLCPVDFGRFYLPTLNLAILWVSTRYLITGAVAWIVALGAVTGIAFVSRIDAAACGLLILAATMIVLPVSGSRPPTRSTVLAGIGGVAAILVPAYALFAAGGVFEGYFAQLLDISKQIFERSTAAYKMPIPSPSPRGVLAAASTGNWFPLQYYVSLIIPAAGVFLLVTARTYRDRIQWALVAGWLLGNLPQYAIERPDLVHLNHRFFALSTAAAIITANGMFGHRGGFSFGGISRRAIVAAAGIAGIFLFVTLSREVPASFVNAWKFHPEACLSNGACFRAVQDRGSVPVELLEAVLRNTSASEPLAVLPFAPGLAYLVRRELPGRSMYVLPNSVWHDGRETAFINAVLESRTQFVLLDTKFRFSPGAAGAMSAYAPAVSRMLVECFALDRSSGHWQLLRRVEADCELWRARHRDQPARSGSDR